MGGSSLSPSLTNLICGSYNELEHYKMQSDTLANKKDVVLGQCLNTNCGEGHCSHFLPCCKPYRETRCANCFCEAHHHEFLYTKVGDVLVDCRTTVFSDLESLHYKQLTIKRAQEIAFQKSKAEREESASAVLKRYAEQMKSPAHALLTRNFSSASTLFCDDTSSDEGETGPAKKKANTKDA
jgi:hypothetical protein